MKKLIQSTAGKCCEKALHHETVCSDCVNINELYNNSNMTKIKLTPLQKIDLNKIEVNQSIEIHADRLASFKSNLSRFNGNQEKAKKPKHRYIYSGVKNDYYTAMRSI